MQIVFEIEFYIENVRYALPTFDEIKKDVSSFWYFQKFGLSFQ